MGEQKWEVVATIAGDFQAELLRGLLEAQDIPVVLSQEGAGHSVFPVTVGALGKVDVLVPGSHLEQALKVVEDFNAEIYDDTEDSDQSADEPSSEE